MTHYNSLNVKLSNSQLNKLKSAIKDETEWLAGDNETNFPHKLLLTNTQVAILRKVLEIIHQQISNYQKLNYLR